MNSSTAFDNGHPSTSAAALPFDFNIHPNSISQTSYTHLSALADHLATLAQIQSRAHPLSADQPPPQNSISSDVLTLSATLQTYHSTLQQLVQPINGDPMVLGAERFVARLKEHAIFLARLETRKRAIRQVKAEIEASQAKKGGVRRDLRFSERRIEALIKELGYIYTI
jgi:hypothetical protein